MSYELANVADYVTSNSASSAFQIGLNSGMTLLAHSTFNTVTEVVFSGSWSHIGVLFLNIIYNSGSGSSVTASVGIGVAGGATFLNMEISATSSAGQITMIEIVAMGGDGQGIKALRTMAAQTGKNVLAATVTANSAFTGQIFFKNSATMQNGVAYLYGLRNT
jgi:hypothetical protein